MKIVYILFAVVFLQSCLNPKEIKVKSDSDIDLMIALLESQPALIYGRAFEKEIFTDDKVEKQKLKIDSSFFKFDFDPLKGKEPQLIFLGGGYTKSTLNDTINYSRNQGEKKGPVSLKIMKDVSGEINFIEIQHEDKNALFESKSAFQAQFQGGKLVAYSLGGYQKLPGMEASSHQVKGKVLLD